MLIDYRKANSLQPWQIKSNKNIGTVRMLRLIIQKQVSFYHSLALT